MKNRHTKISLFILFSLIIVACNTTKRVPENKRLLYKTEISVDDVINKDEELTNQLYQKPNSSILGYRLRLNLFNLAKKNSDSSYNLWLNKNPKRHQTLTKLLSEKQVGRLGKSFLVAGISSFLKKTGEAPVLFDSISTSKSVRRLSYYYQNIGFLDAKGSFVNDTTEKKKSILKYKLVLGKPYILDTLTTDISSPKLDSLYSLNKNNSFLKTNNQYKTEDFNNERNRITSDFRNNGAYFFQPNYITFIPDTIGTHKRPNVVTQIKDYSYRVNDSTVTEPFKLYKISKVAIYTDQKTTKNEIIVNDSINYKGFSLYSEKKLKYRPKSIVNAVFITPGSYYSDVNSVLTTKYLTNLKVFNYPTIQYKVDPNDPNALISNIFLTPRKKYTFNPAVDFTHSTIQDFGISGNVSLGIRNVFNGAETFEIGLRGNVGASKKTSDIKDQFFDISEIGIDAKLNFPRIFFLFNTDRIIPKSMIPYTSLSAGYAKQRNIGLDKQNFTGSFSYNWTPRKNTTMRYELINIQFVKNDNVANYFNIYQSSYDLLNAYANNLPLDTTFFNDNNQLIIESGTDSFINNVLDGTIATSPDTFKSVNSIEERRKRLTENNLIFASNFNFSKTTKKDLYDNNFYGIKAKIESAGNFLSLLARTSKQLDNQEQVNTFLEVQYSQYFKSELEYIKHWDLSRKKVFAIRGFAGIAVPYGNSSNIPFSRSYFSGGTNDNRAWQPYSLGPGNSGGLNDFNEANMKIAFNAEFRFNLFGKFNSAIFADFGNIWNAFDDTIDESYKFKGLQSLNEIAIGSGIGLRYDQGLFVVRFDLGLKTYNPSKYIEQKWFKEINFTESIINIGINYPF